MAADNLHQHPPQLRPRSNINMASNKPTQQQQLEELQETQEPEQPTVTSWTQLKPQTVESYAPWSRNAPNRPQAVSVIGFGLGVLFTLGLISGRHLPSAVFNSTAASNLVEALQSPLLGAYAASMAVFHMSEYLTTAIYNPTQVKVGSYLLHNGLEYHIAHATGVLEFILSETFLPPHLKQWKHVSSLTLAGLTMVVLGQIARSVAMITAASNFNHDVQFVKKAKHELVTNGIYQYSRHPSYAAFFYWAVGTQVFLGNPVSAVGFAVVLYRFFSMRIRYEEQALISFFGEDYYLYRKRVGTLLPFC